MIAENLSKLVNDAVKGVEQLMPEGSSGLRDSIEQLIKDGLEKRLSSMNLVTKEEFQAHNQLLNRLKDRVVELEESLERLENRDAN